MMLKAACKPNNKKRIPPEISRQDYVYNELKQMIADGVISKEERLVERQISEALGLSRVPVREALLRLNAEGVLVSLPKGGFMVKRYTAKEIVELYQLRDAIESYSAKLAAEIGTQEDIQTCIGIHSKLESLRGTEQNYSEYDELFHRAILKAGGNQRMSEIFDILHYQHVCLTIEDMGYGSETDFMDEVIESHGCILDAIKRRDGDAAAIAMSEHINKARKGFLNFMEGESNEYL
ncbi:MAG: GntR family transcriptional regulator [Sedimentisphaeraceae bacterium JB056]